MSSTFSIVSQGSGPQNNNTGGTQNNYFISNLSENHNNEPRRTQGEKEAILGSLAFPNINARQHDIEPAQDFTCDWLFETAEFQEWRDRTDLPTHNGVLWIKGKPGAGKSTLMKHTLIHCEKTFRDHLIVAYFFNARGDVLEKTPQGMLQSIVYQLLNKNTTLYEQFVPFFREQQIAYKDREWSWQQSLLKDFIRSSVKQQQSKPLLFLIDALDECSDPDVRKLVNYLEDVSIKAVQAGTQLRVCLSSRHYPTISMKRKLDLTVETNHRHKDDIAKYVEQKLEMQDHDIQAGIQEKANGIFMWVVIVVSLLNKAYDEGRLEAMQKTLEEVPDDLEGVFENLLEKDRFTQAETILMLQWVLLSARPLTPEEIFAAVVETGSVLPPIDAIHRRITTSSKGLVEVRKGDAGTPGPTGDEVSVQFIHLSVADFLCRSKRLQKLDKTLRPDPISASHGILWARCRSYIEQLDTAVTSSQHMRSLYDSNPFLWYAASHIFYHAEKALLGSKRKQEAIQQWLRKHNDWFPWWRMFITSIGAFAQPGYPKNIDFDGGLLYVFSNQGCVNLTGMLLENGADVNAQGGFYGNALQAASQTSRQAIVELLLAKGADVHAQGGFYGNALQAASQTGRQAIVELLLAKGADVHAQGGEYGNALQAASEIGNQAIIELLLAKGADVHAQGGRYGSALQAASASSASGNQAIVELLLAKGADINIQARVGSLERSVKRPRR